MTVLNVDGFRFYLLLVTVGLNKKKSNNDNNKICLITVLTITLPLL